MKTEMNMFKSSTNMNKLKYKYIKILKPTINKNDKSCVQTTIEYIMICFQYLHKMNINKIKTDLMYNYSSRYMYLLLHNKN